MLQAVKCHRSEERIVLHDFIDQTQLNDNTERYLYLCTEV